LSFGLALLLLLILLMLLLLRLLLVLLPTQLLRLMAAAAKSLGGAEQGTADRTMPPTEKLARTVLLRAGKLGLV
jgi:hypothetical protein